MQVIVPKYVARFLNKLEEELRSKVKRHLIYLEIHGIYLSMPFSKKIGQNLYELRIIGSVHVRIFYSFYGGNIILLHGIVKKTHKIPKKDLELAKRRQKLFD